MADLEYLAKTKNQLAVYVDLVKSHAATHLEDTPQLQDLVLEALAGLKVKGDYLEIELDMGRIIGMTDGVKIEEGDEIIWAKRKNRDSYTVFNKSKVSQPSSFITLALSRQADGSYVLESAFISSGEGCSPPFPDEPKATVASKDYWSKHALAWGTQEIQAGSVTTKCPW